MRIAAKDSHLNGYEYMQVHRPLLWEEVEQAIATVDAARCKTKVLKERTMPGRLLYSPVDMNDEFKANFKRLGWKQRRNTFWVTDDESLMRGIYNQPASEQKKTIEAAGREPIMSYNQTRFCEGLNCRRGSIRQVCFRSPPSVREASEFLRVGYH